MTSRSLPLLPGAWLGMLGGGQLGRYFVLAARRMGYHVKVLDPDAESPAGQLADLHLCAEYHDETALAELANCAAVTLEFENVPAASLAWLAAHTRVTPAPAAVAMAQDRIREKTWLAEHGFALAPFAVIGESADIETAAQRVGFPAILKRAQLGYDGKGQETVHDLPSLRAAHAALGGAACVLEARLALDAELSVVLARGDDGQCVAFDAGENRHQGGILDLTLVPASLPGALIAEARDEAVRLADELAYVGVLGVEFFYAGGRLQVNEIAPRPHNSGHHTLDACATSQFEQQVRALCGLPLGDARLLSPVAMLNLLGDAWPIDWAGLLAQPAVRLHLYGKRDARPGRKMGHVNCLAADVGAAARLAEAVRTSFFRR
jgi:5-(carboxyamino)imidazole ribonucleotide synthase